MNAYSVGFHIMLRFAWPEAEASNDYEAGEAVELDHSYPMAVPIPSVGEEVLFDPEEVGVAGVDYAIGQSDPKRRFFVGSVERRTFEMTVTRHTGSRRDHVSVTLDLANVRRHE